MELYNDHHAEAVAVEIWKDSGINDKLKTEIAEFKEAFDREFWRMGRDTKQVEFYAFQGQFHKTCLRMVEKLQGK
ncbi:hypothetical protein LCGC14_2054650 [marine sediment metagenome]|uniref:Uncharacterized protein n=1 Tax=marine sediment metagenome TaxID=412755 RepID=A0A0F9FAG0_9ZZZZ